MALFGPWKAARDAFNDTPADVGDESEHFARYVSLQRQITEDFTPTTAEELAAQFVVETDSGGSECRDLFFAMIERLANGEAR